MDQVATEAPTSPLDGDRPAVTTGPEATRVPSYESVRDYVSNKGRQWTPDKYTYKVYLHGFKSYWY